MTQLTMRANGRRYKVRLLKDGNRLLVKSPFKFKDEVKVMRGSRWNPDLEGWTIEDHPRNHFQLQAMMVEPTNPNPYAWFERELEPIASSDRPLRPHQYDMIGKGLCYRYQIFAADMGLGKTLISFEIAERLMKQYPGIKIWFVGPKSALESVEVDKHKWDGPDMKLKTYERMTLDWEQNKEDFPQAIFFDECSSVKNPASLRSCAAQGIADAIRAKYQMDGAVILMSGTTVAKRPSDIWSQAEIAFPGFLREGSLRAFKQRYAIMEKGEDADGNTFMKEVGWKTEEVERLPNRLKGLMSVYLKDDWLDLPPRTFEVREAPASARIKRVAKALVSTAPNTITGLTWLRALSSGFQYDKKGEAEGQDRPMVETVCPKDDLLRDILAEEESRGRIIIGASFQGSVDRVRRLCQDAGWKTITVDGRGWVAQDSDEHILDYWANQPGKVAFIGNPTSCRFGLTLVEAKTIVVYDQNFSAEHRKQFLDRNYRIGQDSPVRVIDLLHLPCDKLVLDTLMQNAEMERLSLGVVLESLE